MEDKPLILCVDDEENILKSLQRILRNDFTVSTASNVDEAIAIFQKNKDKINVIITDLKMPGKTGIDLLKSVKEIDRRVVCLILSGQGDFGDTVAAINKDLAFKYLHKPCDGEELIKAVKEAIVMRKSNDVMDVVQEMMADDVSAIEEYYDKMGDNEGVLKKEVFQGIHDKMGRFKKLAEIGMLVSKILHDINNKTSVMRMYLSLMQDNQNYQNQEKAMSMMDASLKSVASMVEDVQFFVTDRHIAPDIQLVNLKKFIDMCLPDIEYLLSKKKIEIIVDIPEDIELKLDERKFNRVVLNLAKNAGEAMREGSLSILAKRGAEGVELRFVDTGRGIPKENCEHIFSPYQTYRSGGVGVGLVNVKEIVNLHGGSITVESDIGQGAKFIMLFPCKT